MKLRIITTFITLSLVLSLALWRVARPASANAVLAMAAQTATYPLDPTQFASLGASPFNATGTYTIDASKDNPAPTLTAPDSTTITGVFYSPSNGAVARDEIAVFTFNSINIPADVTVQGARTGNSRPIALLSQSTITIDGTIEVSGTNGTNGTSEASPTGGTGGNGGNAGPGGGGGAGGAGRNSSAGVGFEGGASGSSQSGGGSVVAGGGGNNGVTNFSGGGGAFGGNGGSVFGHPSWGRGGTAYGYLALKLQGGSGGGGGGSSTTSGSCDPDDGCGPSTIHGGGGGGGGGGAVELGAVGNLTLNGNVLANGGAGGVNLSGHSAGAGAGGGIFLHAVTVALSGNLNARGGNVDGSSVTNGGGGGGGRVLILTADGTLASGSLATNVNVSGGSGYQAGGSGVKELTGPTQVAFAQQPTGTGPNTAISPAITVQVQDAQGHLLTTSTAPVTLALGNNPSGATLGGTLTVNAVGGIATFNNVTVSAPASGYTLVATSGSLTNATSAAFNITCQAITVLPGIGTLPTGTTGSSYSLQFTQRDGVGPITWSVSPPVPGLSIDANGLLSGTPTQSGGFLITVTATDGNGCPGSTSYNLSIACPTITLPSTTLPTGTYNSTYPTTEILPTGGTAPYQFTTTGLPNGMNATASNTRVTLGGTPTQSGNFTVRVTVTDAYSCVSSERNYALTISKASPTITWNNPADITYGTALSATQLNATAHTPGTFSYSPTSGTVLNAGNGQMLTANFTPSDANNYNSTSKQVQINVLKALLTVTVNNAFRNQGQANPPLSGSITGLKNGDNITASYSTTATFGSAPGNYPITATLNDPNNRLGNYQVTNPGGTLKVFNSCGIGPVPFFATQGAVGGYWLYYQPLSASPLGLYTFSLFAGTLPPGLSIVNNFGQYILQGAPTTRGTYTFTLLAKNTANTCEAIHTYTITII